MSMVGFVPEPNCGRGTISLLWSCLTTIFLTNWTSLHLDLDDQSFKHQMYHFVGCLLLPEWCATSAYLNLYEAYTLRVTLRALPEWRSLTFKQAFLVVMKCVQVDPGDASPLRAITKTKILEAAERKWLTFSDLPPDEDIDKRAKGQWPYKVVAILQATWFLANTLGRLVQGTQVSLLENLTVAYTFCGLVMFLAWFRCSQNIAEPYIVPFESFDEDLDPYLDSAEPLSKNAGVVVVLFAGAITAGLAGCQLAEWHFPFPSSTEMWLWRGCSLTMLAMVVFALGCVWVGQGMAEKARSIAFFLGPIASVIYLLCRLITMVLAFATLRQSPKDIYDKPDWPSYFGHIGS